MVFEIVHSTEYRYSHPALEAYLEVRLTPRENSALKILDHQIVIEPQSPISSYLDYFGNETGFYSMTLRHPRLLIQNRIRVRTAKREVPKQALEPSIAEARQILTSAMVNVYDFVQPTPTVPVGGVAKEWAANFLKGGTPLGIALEELNRFVHGHFEYQPGTTDNQTPLERVWKQRRGVCQDFAHVMLSILRTGGLPARYVCGYIESEPSRRPDGSPGLVGSIATHAWVEVLLPGMLWAALDPTNDCWCAEQHVPVSYGRDFRDAAPVRGTFKTTGKQTMKVKVRMRRVSA